MWRDEEADPKTLVCQVGSTRLGCQLRCIEASRRCCASAVIGWSSARPTNRRTRREARWKRGRAPPTTEAEVERLRASGVTFRSDIVRGPGGAQIVLDDPSGNPIELFQPRD